MTDSVYLLPAYNYRVTIKSETQSNVVGFSEVSGLALAYEAVTYKHGMSFFHGDKIIPGMQQPITVTLRRGIAKNRRFLSDWLAVANDGKNSPLQKRDVTIDLCDASANVAVRWIVHQALPIKIEFQGFNVESNEVAIETLELRAQNLEIQYSP